MTMPQPGLPLLPVHLARMSSSPRLRLLQQPLSAPRRRLPLLHAPRRMRQPPRIGPQLADQIEWGPMLSSAPLGPDPWMGPLGPLYAHCGSACTCYAGRLRACGPPRCQCRQGTCNRGPGLAATEPCPSRCHGCQWRGVAVASDAGVATVLAVDASPSSRPGKKNTTQIAAVAGLHREADGPAASGSPSLLRMRRETSWIGQT